MDDECVAELGRPISGMKVTELRDELTRRSLIKTGNKKELIDRLRTAIKRQSSQNAGATDLTIQSATHQLAQQEQPADLSQPEDDDDADDIEARRQLLQQQQQQPIDLNRLSSIATHDRVTPSIVAPNVLSQQLNDSIIIDQPQNLAIKPTQPNLNESAQIGKPLSQSVPPQLATEETESQPTKQASPQPEPILLQKQPVSELEEIQQHGRDENKSGHSATYRGEDSNDAAIGYSSQDSAGTPEQPTLEPTEATHTKTQKIPELKDVGDMSKSAERASQPLIKSDTSPSVSQSIAPSSNESEKPSAYVPITLKRGAPGESRNSSEQKEKRRKWSTKTESSQSTEAAPHSDLTSVGISSQKLQQLIEVRKAEKLEAEKATAAAKASSSKNNEKVTDIETKKKKNEPDNKVTDQEPTDKLAVTKDKHKEHERSAKADASESNKRTSLEANQEEEKEEAEPDSGPTNILLVQNLVRPFTLSQLKEVLTKYGPMVEEKFWTDKVKSTCCVMFSDTSIAQQTREALNGQQWPSSNPKTLKVTYIDEETLTKYMNQEVKKVSDAETAVADSQETDEASKAGQQQTSGRAISNRLGNKVDDADGVSLSQSVKKRLGDKVTGEIGTKSSNINRASDNSHPQELDDLFKRTKSIPHLFWLPLSEDQAEVMQKKRAEKEARHQELARKAPARRVTPPRYRSPARRSPVRHRSPARRSPPPRRRSPGRRSPIGRSPIRRLSPSRYRSPIRRSPVGHRSPARRRTPPPTRSSPPRRRSPGPTRRSPGPIRRSPPRRSPLLIKRSPGPSRRSPGPIRRSPGPIRRSPGPIRRSPGPIRRSPGPMRRSPIRRSPGPIRRSPAHVRRSPAPLRGVSPTRRSRSRSRSVSSSRSRSPVRRRSRTPTRRKSPIGYGSEPRRAQRFDRIR